MKGQVSSLAVLAAAFALTLPGLAAAQDAHAHEKATSTATLAATQDALRDLWIGHIFWVRAVVDARFDDDDGAAKAAEQQVVANAQDIAGAIEPFYGEAASKQLFELLAGHWGAISDYLDATIEKRKANQDTAFQALVDNANAIAQFLGAANPHWPVETVKGLLVAHGSHHVQQIQQFAAGDFEQEAKTWTVMKNHMYVIADALTDGLAKQFPEKLH